MQEPTHRKTIDELLDELTGVLAQERVALIRVDAESIEQLALVKSHLNDELAERSSSFSSAHLQRFKAIQLDVRHNIVLLVHARDYIHTRLALVTGRIPTTRPFSKPVAESVRLDLRG